MVAKLDRNRNCLVYLMVDTSRNRRVLKRKYLHRRYSYTSATVGTAVIGEVEDATSIFRGNHAAHCCYGNIENSTQTAKSEMGNDFDPIIAFGILKKVLKLCNSV